MREETLPLPWQLFLAEVTGTALLLLLGLSSVILMFGVGNPFEQFVANLAIRRSLNGIVFGSIGTAIALSPIGKVSGAHINPIVTMAFWLVGKLRARAAIGYVIAQFLGALLGSLPLLLWGRLGRSINFAATQPGTGYSIPLVIMGEVITTFCFISTLCVFLAFHKLRRFTPFVMPILFAIMVPLEADISGMSLNPARSFGSAVISGIWMDWWIYWIGPLTGGLLSILVCNALAKRIEVAKLYHFDSDPQGVFRRVQRPSVATT
jgi:aquaporin Z